MKTAVIGEGETEGIVYNRALVDLARHYGFHPRACRPYRAKTKGKVERPFRYIREDFFLARSFRNLDDLNAQLRHWLDSVANPHTHATTLRVVNEAFAEERPHLRPLPLAAFRSVLKLERRISREAMVSVGGGNELQCSRRDPQPDGRSPFARGRGPYLENAPSILSSRGAGNDASTPIIVEAWPASVHCRRPPIAASFSRALATE